MRALLVTGRKIHLPGGVEGFSRLVTRCLEMNGWHIDCLTANDLVRRNSFRAHHELLLTWRIGMLASQKSRDYDLVISNGSWGAWISRRVPRINAYHGTAAGGYRSFPRLTPTNRVGMLIKTLLERKSGRHAYNVALSEAVRNEIERYYRNHVDAVIEYGIDLDFYRPPDPTQRHERRRAHGINEDELVVIYVGRMEFAKGLDLWNAVAERTPAEARCRFMAVCPRIEERWRSPRVMYLIGGSPDRVREAYSVADVMLFPSRYEGWGLVTMEALASGVVVIGGPTGATASLKARSPVLGQFVVDEWEQNQFYGKLNTYVNLEMATRQALRHQARYYAEQWASLSRFRLEWDRAVNDALDLGGKP